MLWREPYRPRLIENASLPSALADGVLLGAFDLRAQSELGVWWRLLESADLLPRTSLVLLARAWPERDRRLASAVLPRSMQICLGLIEDTDESWRSLIEPDRPERSFASVVKGGRTDLLVIGPPTEEIWERFEALAANLSPREAPPSAANP